MINAVFDDVWDTVKDLQGKEFRTVSGKKFHYACKNGSLIISPEDEKVGSQINEKNFFQVYQYMTQYVISDPDDVDSVALHKGENEIEGSAYIWSVLNDKRVLEQDYRI